MAVTSSWRRGLFFPTDHCRPLGMVNAIGGNHVDLSVIRDASLNSGGNVVGELAWKCRRPLEP
jgi:hypothetical protein